MRETITRTKNEKGQALLVAMIFLLALTFLGFGLITVATIDIHSARNMRLAEEAFNAAEEGAIMALAYASEPSIQFSGMEPGYSVNLDSVTHAGKKTKDRSHYQVTLKVENKINCPVGYMIGKRGEAIEESCFQIRIRSTGMVTETANSLFDLSNRPKIQRTVEILARIRVPN